MNNGPKFLDDVDVADPTFPEIADDIAAERAFYEDMFASELEHDSGQYDDDDPSPYLGTYSED